MRGPVQPGVASANLICMDAEVLAAVAKWPNVPAVFGWLSLSARGEWRIRGEPIANAAIREFIGRNYAADAQGRWFFQNGPQRAYVTLECAPWVYRVQSDGSLRTHTGLTPSQLRAAALIDDSIFVLSTDLGAGSIDDRDTAQFLAVLADASGAPLPEPRLEAALKGEGGVFVVPGHCAMDGAATALRPMRAGQLAAAFGFEALPQPA
jgi:hypothetical protein